MGRNPLRANECGVAAAGHPLHPRGFGVARRRPSLLGYASLASARAAFNFSSSLTASTTSLSLFPSPPTPFISRMADARASMALSMDSISSSPVTIVLRSPPGPHSTFSPTFHSLHEYATPVVSVTNFPSIRELRSMDHLCASTIVTSPPPSPSPSSPPPSS